MMSVPLQDLSGRRILITRSRQQASLLASELGRHGAIPLLIPTIAISPPATFAELDRSLQQLDRFDWLVFTSANAVAAFAGRRSLLGITTLPQRIASIGPATARALTEAGLTPTASPVLLPATAIAESLAAALIPCLDNLKSPAAVLLVRAESARDLLPEALTAAGATVTLAAAYRNVIPPESAALLQGLFAPGRLPPDAVTFTSSSTASNLVALLEAAHLQLPASVLRISIGPVTSSTLRDLDLPPHLEASEATIPSLVQAVIHAFADPVRPA